MGQSGVYIPVETTIRRRWSEVKGAAVKPGLLVFILRHLTMIFSVVLLSGCHGEIPEESSGCLNDEQKFCLFHSYQIDTTVSYELWHKDLVQISIQEAFKAVGIEVKSISGAPFTYTDHPDGVFRVSSNPSEAYAHARRIRDSLRDLSTPEVSEYAPTLLFCKSLEGDRAGSTPVLTSYPGNQDFPQWMFSLISYSAYANNDAVIDGTNYGYAFTCVHELGHQVGGLRHPADAVYGTSYHAHETTVEFKTCVMHDFPSSDAFFQDPNAAWGKILKARTFCVVPNNFCATGCALYLRNAVYRSHTGSDWNCVP